MKKVKIHAKVEEAAKEREKRWKELRSLMEQNDDINTPNLKLIPENKDSEVDSILKEIGMEKYSSTMKENGVDDKEILLELQENHLEEMGIVLGHRLKIMKKIRELKGELTCTPLKSEKLAEPRESFQKSSLKPAGRETPQKSSKLEGPMKPSPLKERQDSRKKFITVEEIFSYFGDEEKKDPEERNPKVEVKLPPKIPQQISYSLSEKPKNNKDSNLLKTVKTHNTDANGISSAKSPGLKMQKTRGSSEKNLMKGAASQHSPVTDIRATNTVSELLKPPLASKPVPVSKTLPTNQPSSNENEKNPKPSNGTNKEEQNGEGLNYVPYKPSEEIQAISHKLSSRPASAREAKVIEKEEKFDVAGWDN